MSEFQTAMEGILKEALEMEFAVGGMYRSMKAISARCASSFSNCGDDMIKADCLKFKDAMDDLARHRVKKCSLSQFEANLHFNLLDPLREHVANAQRLNGLIARRRELVKEGCCNVIFQESLIARGMDMMDDRLISGREELRKFRMALDEIDQELLDWRMIFREYRDDIFDSTTQTVKSLLYQVLSRATTQLESVTVPPDLVVFRPMFEMVPRVMERDIYVIREAKRIGSSLGESTSSDRGNGYSSAGLAGIARDMPGSGSEVNSWHYVPSFSSKLSDRIEAGESDYGGYTKPVPVVAASLVGPNGNDVSVAVAESSSCAGQVDAMDLAALVTMGFDEASSIHALLRGGDVTRAMELLLTCGKSLARDELTDRGSECGTNGGVQCDTEKGTQGDKDRNGVGQSGTGVNLSCSSDGALPQRHPVSLKLLSRLQELQQRITAHNQVSAIVPGSGSGAEPRSGSAPVAMPRTPELP